MRKKRGLNLDSGNQARLVLPGFILVSLACFSVSKAAIFQGLGHLSGGSSSEATAVSADGSVIAGSSDSNSGQQAFRWTISDGIVGIPIPGGLTECWATDVSAEGRFVAGYGRASNSPPYGYEGFRWHVSGDMNRIAEPEPNVIAKGICGDG